MNAPNATQRPSAAPHLVLWLLVLLAGAFGAWSYFGKLDVVSNAYGEVVPSTQVKSVEHFEGGIIREILVREGDRVIAEQPLVTLDPVRSDADVQELNLRQLDLSVEVARLAAESSWAEDITFPEGVAESHPDLAARARELFHSRQSRIASRLASQDERIAQRKGEIASIKRRIANNRERLKLINEQIKISEGLMEDQLTNRMNHLNLLKEAAALKSRISEDRDALPRAEAAIKEAEADRAEFEAEYLQEVRENLSQARAELREVEVRLTKFEDTLSRTVLRSPVDGVVKTLHVATVGGVVQPGVPVVDIVPGSDRLVIEARLPTQEIGYVHSGQKVQVTLASHDAARLGRIEGEVVNVSPDTIETGDGVPYYKIRVETSKSGFESDLVRYELVPGVQVACAIRTGQRTVLAYLLDPFLTSVQTALRER